MFVRSFAATLILAANIAGVKKVTNPLDWNEVDASVQHSFKMQDPHFDDKDFDPSSALLAEGAREAGLIKAQEDSFIKSMLSLRELEQKEEKGEPIREHTKFVPKLKKLNLD